MTENEERTNLIGLIARFAVDHNLVLPCASIADYLLANGVKILVQCKDCKYADYSGCSGGMVYCMEHACSMDENGFCSDGEREENYGV